MANKLVVCSRCAHKHGQDETWLFALLEKGQIEDIMKADVMKTQFLSSQAQATLRGLKAMDKLKSEDCANFMNGPEDKETVRQLAQFIVQSYAVKDAVMEVAGLSSLKDKVETLRASLCSTLQSMLTRIQAVRAPVQVFWDKHAAVRDGLHTMQSSVLAEAKENATNEAFRNDVQHMTECCLHEVIAV